MGNNLRCILAGKLNRAVNTEGINNNNPIMEAGGSGSNTVCNGPTGYYLDGGKNIRVVLREEGGDARIKLWWDTNTATCLPKCYGLNTSANPSGSGWIGLDPQPNCAGGYTDGTSVQLTANPYSGYSFANWTGASFTTSTTNPLTVSNVTQNLTIMANFTNQNAASLAYTDPGSGSYLLKKNTALSTATHLVLDLVGPATTGSGVSVTLAVDTTKVAWANVASTDAAGTYVQNGGTFNLGAGLPILKGKVSAGVLQVTVAQKGSGSPLALNTPLVRVALDLKTGQLIGAIALSADSTKCQVLDGAGTIVPIVVGVGTLSAQ